MQITTLNAAQPAADPRRRHALRPESLTPVRRRLSRRGLAAAFALCDALAVLTLALAIGGRGLFGVAALQLLSLHMVAAYRIDRRDAPRRLTRIVLALTGATLSGLLIGLPATLGDVVTMAALILGLSLAWTALTSAFHRQGRLTPNLAVVGATPGARRLIERLTLTGDAAVLGLFDDRMDRVPEQIGGVPVLGDLDALIHHRLTPFVDRIVVAVPNSANARVAAMVERLGVLPNEISLLLDDGDEAAERIAALPLARLSGAGSSLARIVAKRAQDLMVGSIALILAAPVMALVAVAIRRDSPGPIFFRQARHGFHNETILVWKFRSMRQESTDATAAQQVRVGDSRVTKVGAFIRRTSLDELPQLFNVLKGEMSLVGPRPHAIGMKTGAVESAALVGHYAHRHRMKPGMTGWAAIHGSRGPVDTPELVRERVRLDVEYIERQSFWLDLYIMAMTIPCLLGDRNTPR